MSEWDLAAPPPEETGHEQPVCVRCEFVGYVVACVWKGEANCQMTFPAVPPATDSEE